MGQRPDNRSRARRAFTVVEVMIVLLIMSIIAVIAIDAVATFEANQRADRAAREVLALFRYGRSLAMTTGRWTKVVINTSNGSVSLYPQSVDTTTTPATAKYDASGNPLYDTTPVATGMTSTGTWVITMNSSRELVGTSLSLASSTANVCQYSPLGNCTINSGTNLTSVSSTTLTFTYGTKTKSLIVKRVGDPTLQ